VATQVPTVTSVEIVPVQPEPADRKVLAFQRARTNRPLEDVAYIVKIFLADELPPTGAGFALYLGHTPVPRYSGFDGGIYFTVHDPQFLADHVGQPIRFEHDSGQVVKTDARLPELLTPEATRFGLLSVQATAGVILPTKREALTQIGSPAAQDSKTFSPQPTPPLRPNVKTILFIDDETHFASYDIEAMKDANYEVIHHDTAAGGLAHIREHSGEIDLIVLDIVMPTPKDVAPTETNGGLDTGIWLLRQVRDLIAENLIPVIVLSGRGSASLEHVIADVVALPEGLVQVTSKTVTPPRFLPNLISHMLRKSVPKP
jgi:CheY-like chemotaxis protein